MSLLKLRGLDNQEDIMNKPVIHKDNFTQVQDLPIANDEIDLRGVFFAIPLATLLKAIYNAWPKHYEELEEPEETEHFEG